MITTAVCVTNAKGKNTFHKTTASDRDKLNLNCQPVFNVPWRAMTMARTDRAWAAGSPLLTPGRGNLVGLCLQCKTWAREKCTNNQRYFLCLNC